MESNHNLDINTYSFDELLGLFNLSYNFSINDLKECKKKVLFMHPDKSKKTPEYFLFYKKAFEIIVQYYEEKTKQSIEVPTTEMLYVPTKPTTEGSHIQNIIKSMKPKDFNNTFNDLFDKNMAVKPDESRNAWFKNGDNQFKIDESVSIQNLGKVMEGIKKDKNDLVKYKGVETIYSSSGAGTSFLYDDAEDKDAYVSCDLFSKLKFDDLRKVHKDQTIFNVAESDFEKMKTYKSVEEMNRDRGTQNLTPLEKSASEQMMKRQHDEYEKIMLKRQHESKLKTMEYEQKDKNVQAYFMRLTK